MLLFSLTQEEIGPEESWLKYKSDHVIPLHKALYCCVVQYGQLYPCVHLKCGLSELKYAVNVKYTLDF